MYRFGSTTIQFHHYHRNSTSRIDLFKFQNRVSLVSPFTTRLMLHRYLSHHAGARRVDRNLNSGSLGGYIKTSIAILVWVRGPGHREPQPRPSPIAREPRRKRAQPPTAGSKQARNGQDDSLFFPLILTLSTLFPSRLSRNLARRLSLA